MNRALVSCGNTSHGSKHLWLGDAKDDMGEDRKNI